MDKFYLEYGYTLDDLIDDLIAYRNLYGGEGEVWLGHIEKEKNYPVSNICRRITRLGAIDVLLEYE